MDPLSKLPLECLQRILKTLAQDNNSAALAALLRTSRYISTAALSSLYREPFKFTPFESHHSDNEDIPIANRIPTRVLFVSLPHSNLSKILSLGLELPVTDSALDAEAATAIVTPTAVTPTSLSRVNYLAQIRHLHFQPWAIGVDHLWRWSHAPPGVLAYIQTEEFVQMCHLTRLIPTHLRFRMHKLDTEFYQRCYQVLFFREASWVLASPILEQLQSLSIHLSQIGRYAAEVGRLRNLKTVIFIIDEIALEPRLVRMPGKRESEKERRENAVRFRPMVQFVEEHVRLFGGVLKSVKMVGSGLWTRIRSFPEVYSDSIQMEINRLLPVLWTPAGASLSHDEMLRFLANPEITDLSGVVKINAWGLDVGGRDVLLENRGALQRCRALKRLKIQSLGEGSFKWAVDKKRMLEQYGQTRPIQGTITATGRMWV